MLVTHDLEEALVLADRLVLMSGAPGRILDVVELTLPRPRESDDPRLRETRARLWRHLEEEVALHEFLGSELAALREHGVTPALGAADAPAISTQGETVGQ
jgi:NitT/TauT family transport system ATP-binding protein